MIGNIDNIYYCSADAVNDTDDHYCSIFNSPCNCGQNGDCRSYHRKYPNLQQFKEEYGVDYQKHYAIYYLSYYDEEINCQEWEASTLEILETFYDDTSKCIIVCACTPWGRPDSSMDWRPEKIFN